MRFKTDPSYATINYYYSNNSISDKIFYKKGIDLIASSLITEDGRAYLNLGCFGKPIAMPENLSDNGIYPYNWCNIKEIEWLIKNQPFDIPNWNNGTSMYSKDFWKTALKDLREVKINFIKNDYKKELNWIHNFM
jgi:hypothetical protein